MKIRARRSDGNTVYLDTDVTELYIDGIPYAPPAPKPVQRWECNVTLIGTDTDFCYPAMHGERGGHKHERAHVHVGFDAQGRVWWADQRAKELALLLRKCSPRTEAGYIDYGFSLVLREAADRLAGPVGPEPDAT